MGFGACVRADEEVEGGGMTVVRGTTDGRLAVLELGGGGAEVEG
jgi:hypothetical protein